MMVNGRQNNNKHYHVAVFSSKPLWLHMKSGKAPSDFHPVYLQYINSVMSIKEYSLTNIFFHLLCSQDSFQKKFKDFEWVLHSDWRNPTLLLSQDFSQVWIFWCLSRFELLLKVFLHSLHLNGFSPVWITWCRISEELRVKDFPHLTHS